MLRLVVVVGLFFLGFVFGLFLCVCVPVENTIQMGFSMTQLRVEILLLRCMVIGKKTFNDADTSGVLQNSPFFLFKSGIDLAWVQCVL